MAVGKGVPIDKRAATPMMLLPAIEPIEIDVIDWTRRELDFAAMYDEMVDAAIRWHAVPAHLLNPDDDCPPPAIVKGE